MSGEARPDRPPHAHPVHAARAVDASMSLLNEVMYRPVELGYAEAAARPEVERTPAARLRRGLGSLLVAVLLGVVTVTAIASLRAPQSSTVDGRTLLQQQIADRSATVADLQARNAELSAEIAALQEDALAEADPELFAELAETEVLSGAVAVQGPGLVVELEDPPAGDGPVDPASRVQALDLQILTNGLWAAGAEAIAINGERLTSLSAIRGAGQAILVDLSPLLPPYRVEAVGDARELQIGLARTGAAGHLTMLSGTYDISSTMRARDDLSLPGAGGTELRYAHVPVRDDLAVGEDDDVTTDEGTS